MAELEHMTNDRLRTGLETIDEHGWDSPAGHTLLTRPQHPTAPVRPDSISSRRSAAQHGGLRLRPRNAPSPPDQDDLHATQPVAALTAADPHRVARRPPARPPGDSAARMPRFAVSARSQLVITVEPVWP